MGCIVHTFSQNMGSILLIFDLLIIVGLVVLLKVLIKEGSLFVCQFFTVNINGGIICRIHCKPSKFRNTCLLMVSIGLCH